jgi:indolepyruvate ferredoxin oxidoreductase
MARELTDYHNAAYAKRYRDLMAHVTGQAEAVAGGERFARGVARYGYKLMAFKDEWEVARLYADPAYKKALSEAFTGVKTVKLHLAPPLLSKKDPETGELQKRAFGPWVFQAMALMAKFRFLRGTPVDIFSKTAERKMERRLRDEYETLMRDLADTLTPQRLETSVALAELPDMVRGYGHVKDRNVEHYEAEKARLIARLDEAGDDAGEERETPLLIAAE